MKPPLLPEEALHRVHTVAARDGRTLLWISGFFAVITALSGDKLGALAGVLAAGAGAIELHGVRLLEAAETRAMRWLVASQLLLMAVILAYVTLRISEANTVDVHTLINENVRKTLSESQMTETEFAKTVHQFWIGFYVLVGIVGAGYQLRLAIFYWTRHSAVKTALLSSTNE